MIAAPIAIGMSLAGIAGLFYLERDGQARASAAVVLAVVWFCLGASRMASEWLGGVRSLYSPGEYVIGSPFDRAILGALLAGGLSVLAARRRRSTAFIVENAPLLLFFFYCLASVLWSDYPFVALKRWTKGIGNVVMVLVVLTDPHPSAAIRRFFAWSAFLLIPASVLLIAYVPGSGYVLNRWTATVYYTGAATDKNGLGTICLVIGLASLWRMIRAARDDSAGSRLRPLAAHGLIGVLSLWLMIMAQSATAFVALAVGSAVLLATAIVPRVRPALVHAGMLVLASVLLGVWLIPDVGHAFTWLLGRDIELTGRRDLWRLALEMKGNPWLGVGFESFWLGDRAWRMWTTYYFHPNQAHNGYLETYLTLGWVGVLLLLVLIGFGYRNILADLQQRVPSSTLKLAFLCVALVYNMTEAAFKVMHPVWIVFLFAVIAVPQPFRDARVG